MSENRKKAASQVPRTQKMNKGNHRTQRYFHCLLQQLVLSPPCCLLGVLDSDFAVNAAQYLQEMKDPEPASSLEAKFTSKFDEHIAGLSAKSGRPLR